MSQLQEASPRAGASGAAGGAPASSGFYSYVITNSVRMSLSANSTLKRTAGTPSSGKTFTYSWWFKKYDIDSTSTQSSNVFCAGTGGGTYVFFPFQSSGGHFDGNFTGGNFGDNRLTTNMVFRDPSSWYHCILRFDSTQSATTSRVRMYVNGFQPSYSDYSVQSAIAQDGTYSFMNQSGVVQSWGGISGVGTGSEGVDCQLAEVILCDGQSYGPDSFGETVNGVWRPKDPSGLTFGNNGYHLKFTNSSNLGEDFSGNDNDFTVANISSHDQMTDTPTFGGSTGGNFATINPIFRGTETSDAKYGTLSEGNLKLSYSSSSDAYQCCTIKLPPTGKYYWEYLINAGGGNSNFNPGFGIFDANGEAYASGDGGNKGFVDSIVYNNGDNNVYKARSSTKAYDSSRGSDGDVMGIAVDMDNGAFYVSKNGTFYSSGDPTSGASRTNAGATWTPATEYTSGVIPLACCGGGSTPRITANFGQEGTFAGQKTAGGNADTNGFGNFFSAVPTGYSAVSTGGISVAAGIDAAGDDGDTKNPTMQFGTQKYTGNNSQRTITTNFRVDWVLDRMWQYSQNWYCLDTSRGMFGSTNYYLTFDDYSSAEGDLPQDNFVSQDDTGFVINGNTWFNSGGAGYQTWYWKCNGGTKTSETEGSINTTVQVNTDAGFSIVQYTGDGGSSDCSMAHNLGAKPAFVILKDRDLNGNNKQWQAWHKELATNGYFYLSANGQAYTSTNGTVKEASNTNTLIFWNRTSTTGGSQTMSENGDNFIMYIFAEVEGMSRFGKYVGNGDSNGTYCYTGFEPAMIWIKRTDSSGGWHEYDNARSTYNPADNFLLLESNSAQDVADSNDIDFLSNGFKIRNTAAGLNGGDNDYVYCAWAFRPFKYGTASLNEK
tara:strand:+ start:459 stop:3110 length:2652 start_codon:yes stop_codon:yes gene_type:complete